MGGHAVSNETSPLPFPKSALSRRDFLQLSALAALSSTIVGSTVSVLAPRSAAQPSPAEPEQWHYSYCRMCMMPECSTLVRTQNGVVTHIKGDPKNPYNQGTLCPRGQGAIMNLYNPYRLKAPMKRTNPQKGLDVDPGWAEISWDEALDTIAKRLRKIKSEDPRKLVINSGFGSFPDSDLGWTIFSEAFGTPNSIHTNGPLCAVHYAPLSTHGTFTDRVDLERCNYALLIGTSLGANWALAKGSGRQYINALERGMKAVVVDPRCGPEASKATQWVPIRPGTELPFVLAVTNTIVNEIGIYDVEFLKWRTNGPYLINASGDYLRDTKTNKPLIWDAAAGKARPFDDPSLKDPALEGSFTVGKETVKPAFQLLKEHLTQYTADWASNLTTISAKTIRQIARDFVSEARIGGTITLNGYEFPFRPVAIWVKRGTIAHKDGQLVQLASKLLNTIVGAMDVPGAIQGDNCGPKLTPGPDGTVMPTKKTVPQADEWDINEFKFPPDSIELQEFYPNKHSLPHIAWKAILNPKKYYIEYPVEALMVYGANPIVNNANSKEPIEAYRKIPFIFSIAYHLDEPSEMADIVLPEPSNLERLVLRQIAGDGKSCDDETRGIYGLNFRYPVVKPLYNTRQGDDVLLDLSRRIGIHPKAYGMLNGMWRLKDPYKLNPGQKYTWEQIVDRKLRSDYDDDKGLEYFKKNGSTWTIRRLPLEKTYNYYFHPMGETRIPIYFEHLKAAGDSLRGNLARVGAVVPGWDMEDYFFHFQPLIHWKPTHLDSAPKDNDLFIVNWKTPFVQFGLAGNVENPWFHEIATQFDPYQMTILINRATARKRGLKDGDKVLVESQWGKMDGVLKLTELIHPEVIGVAGNFGRRSLHMNPISRIGPNFNQLLSPDEGTIDPIGGGLCNTARVKLTRRV